MHQVTVALRIRKGRRVLLKFVRWCLHVAVIILSSRSAYKLTELLIGKGKGSTLLCYCCTEHDDQAHV